MTKKDDTSDTEEIFTSKIINSEDTTKFIGGSGIDLSICLDLEELRKMSEDELAELYAERAFLLEKQQGC